MECFDVIVVGGGIIGAGVARDAALRGLSVALFEKEDFGGATTAGSTRLIHGGLRYLEMLDFRLVRMDLRERETLLRIAPHLVKPLEFVVPFYDRGWLYRRKMKLGMTLYDALSYDRSLPGHGELSARQTLDRLPHLKERGLQGAVTYYDAQVEMPERLCLENIVDARAHGAVVRNYCEVTGSLPGSGGIGGVRVRDSITGEIEEARGRVVVNASGPWFDRVATTLAPNPSRILRTTKGIHIACRPIADSATVLFASDNRLFFVIPWLGYSWIGTTDTDFEGDPATVRATQEEIDYLIDSSRQFFPDLRGEQVLWSNAGVRALVRKPGSESSVSRLHKIVDGARMGAQSLVSIAGGKITGYRAIAEEAVDMVCAKLGNGTPCATAQTRLPGAGLNRGSGTHLYRLYGSNAAQIEDLAEAQPELRRPLAAAYPDIAAQVPYAVHEEQCRRLTDFLFRRTMLGFSTDQGVQAAPEAAKLMGQELGWSAAQQAAELERFDNLAQRARV